MKKPQSSRLTMEKKFEYDIIVIGTSAGGVEALKILIGSLPYFKHVTIFIVIHIYSHSKSILPLILAREGHWPVSHPIDGEKIKKGHIYVASPNNHMLIENGYIRLKDGPKVNNTIPAIDPLFYTASSFYGPRVIGIILTGMLDDGTAGLFAIKKAGGIAMIQDPFTAKYPDMPTNAQDKVPIDYCLQVEEMAAVLEKLTAQTKLNVRKKPLIKTKNSLLTSEERAPTS